MKKLAIKGLNGIYSLIKGRRFISSDNYWRERYVRGETSGSGSYGRLATFKADRLNEIVSEHAIGSVLELGCGDGAQLQISRYPRYLGVDISMDAIAICQQRFQDDATKSFMTLGEFRATRPRAELALSLDVIYHLVEDEILESHLHELFGAAERLVAIYSSNSDFIVDPAPHVRHRHFTPWIEANQTDWRLLRAYRNPYRYRWWARKNSSPCDLLLFERR